MDFKDRKNWMLLPPGNQALCRQPVQMSVPQIQGLFGAAGIKLAGLKDILVANQGASFPWGYYPDDTRAPKLWKEHRVGYGGLIHNNWFITHDGRVGGAPNVTTAGPGALRHCLLLDGGGLKNGQLENLPAPEDNEGFALVMDTDEQTQDMYRRVQLFAAQYVAADRGAIIVSPITEQGVVYCGFVGRCQICPNPELLSYKQLQATVPGYRFELWDEWKNWKV
jgi:Fe-S cluster biogenesis protein NfuA